MRYYLLGDTTPASFVVQNAVNGVVKEQTQPAVAQGWVALHVPPQVVELLAPLRNCLAETVPAQRTTATTVASNVVFISFLLMLVFLSYSKSKIGLQVRATSAPPRPELGATNKRASPSPLGRCKGSHLRKAC
jgi:hypothetical protein